VRTIYKYDIDGVKHFHIVTLKMPANPQVIHVEEQKTGESYGLISPHLCLWAIVDLSHDMTDYKFMLFPTGGNFDTPDGGPPWEYIKTIQNPPYVWHLIWREGP
jgi:hypothetical protein